MRMFEKLAVTLLLGVFATSANAHIEFIDARFVALDRAADHWVLKLEIHRWNNGGPVESPPRPATVYVRRDPRCIRAKQIYLGTQEEFDRALVVLRAQLAAGGKHVFGFNVTPLTDERDEFIAVNLRVGNFHGAEPIVWAVASEAGFCRFKPDKNS